MEPTKKMSRRLVAFTNLSVLLCCLVWHASVISAEKEFETNTEVPVKVKLSAYLRNISLSLHKPTNTPRTTVPASNSSTTQSQFSERSSTTAIPSAPRLPFRRRIRTRIRYPSLHTNSSFPLRKHADDGEIVVKAAKSRRENARHLNSEAPISKISGTILGGKQKPEEVIRKALINHTLEHGGEQDLDKLVFQNLPNGSKLVFRTVKIIRTDGDGNPMDESEKKQPTYWDVTLANATGIHENDEEDDDEPESSEESDEEDKAGDSSSTTNASTRNEAALTKELDVPIALKSTDPAPGESEVKLRIIGKKRPDLEISGSHSAANYHHLNDYGTTGREKEHGTTNFHGNTHGNSHKQTYTLTDGKDVKPYHGTEKGVTDYANEHGKQNKDQGERFKTSKRKNKGRKVTGFKRVYHKEEYQRTEHFYDDEEAKKIAESFGLSESKKGNNHGTKDDKRNYNGVHTEYLDGKKLENEHGTHDGYNKGQHTTYKDSEKHGHHSNYGKSHSHGSSPQQHNHHDYDDNYQQNHHNDQQQQQHHSSYHPNHNYHASYSNPKKTTIAQLPKTFTNQLGGSRSVAAIVSAPMAHSFTLTEYSPLVAESISSPDPTNQSGINTAQVYTYDAGNLTDPLENFETNQTFTSNHDASYKRRRPFRKRPKERKIFFSPKHRPVKEDENLQYNNEQLLQSYSTLPKRGGGVPMSYQVLSSVSDILDNSNANERGQVVGEVETKHTPYAPNFGPPQNSELATAKQQQYPRENDGIYSKTVHWPPRRHNKKRPRHRPAGFAPINQMHLISHKPPARYPMKMHLAGIPFRHASAFHKLGNRHQRYHTLKHHPKRLYPFEISTRKSDTIESDNSTLLYPPDNDSAHYFNHNHRYAKHHLTSTTNPLQHTDPNNKGVRNTLFDPEPDVYSTVIKVLPATMLSFNNTSHRQSVPTDLYQLGSNRVNVSGQFTTITQRPLTQADTISITTAYPQPYLEPEHQRPFLPKNRWLTFTLPIPDLKLGNDFGLSGHRVKKGSYIMQGIKNGLLKQFGRKQQSQVMPPAAMMSQQNYQTHGSSFSLNPGSGPQIIMHKRPKHPIFAHNVVTYGNFGRNSPSPVTFPLQTISSNNEKPQFYYKPKEFTNGTTVNEAQQASAEESRGNSKENNVYKPTLKVPKTKIRNSPIRSGTKVQAPSTRQPEIRKPAKPTQSPPFINGIMDSVSDFFGQMG